MDDVVIARAIHVLAVLFWIGGVAFVTLVAMPSIRAEHPPAGRLAAFRRLESRFAGQARFWVLLAGISGFWMMYRAQMWDRLLDPRFWWMYAMIVLWVIFSAMLFVIEPLFLHRRMEISSRPAADFDRIETAHRMLLGFSAITLLGAVAGSHGLL